MVHNYKTSGLEHRTRNQQGFDKVESSLPQIRESPVSDRSDAQDILSHLGSHNPFGKEITDNDTVWLLDNTAFRDRKTGEWHAEFVAAVFDKHTGLEVSTVVADIAEKLGIGKGDAQEARIAERLMPFMQRILPGRLVNVEFGGTTSVKLGPGGRNAISSDLKRLPSGYKGGDVATSLVIDPNFTNGVERGFTNVPNLTNGVKRMKTSFAEPEGWGIISDIDDTIKITQTSSPVGILQSTFVADATPVDGMPELYTFIERLLTQAAPFFYLSASPYNLYAFLRKFRQQYYPHGTLILRDASWRNLSGLLSNLTLGTQEYKVDRMIKIHSWLPRKQMLAIGDSTQSDPEAYGEIYRKFPGWIQLILIRKVTDIAALGIEEKNEPERFERAFKDVPNEAWHVFESPVDCYDIIKSAVARNR